MRDGQRDEDEDGDEGDGGGDEKKGQGRARRSLGGSSRVACYVIERLAD